MIKEIEDSISQLFELSEEHDLPMLVLYAPKPGQVGMRTHIELPTPEELEKARASGDLVLVDKLKATIVSCVVIDKCADRINGFMAGKLTKEEERDLSSLDSLGIEIQGTTKLEGSDHVH